MSSKRPQSGSPCGKLPVVILGPAPALHGSFASRIFRYHGETARRREVARLTQTYRAFSQATGVAYRQFPVQEDEPMKSCEHRASGRYRGRSRRQCRSQPAEVNIDPRKVAPGVSALGRHAICWLDFFAIPYSREMKVNI